MLYSQKYDNFDVITTVKPTGTRFVKSIDSERTFLLETC